MSSNNKAENIYSYHTFLLAFHYDGDNKPAENGNWKKDAAAKYHNPLLEAYLTAYVGKK